MYYVYLLKSTSHPKKLYIGYTVNLPKRLNEHNTTSEGYTSNFQPWKLVYYEAYESKILAIEREKQFKRHGNVTARLKTRLHL